MKPLVKEIQTKDLVSVKAFRKAFSRICDLFVRRKEGYALSKNDFTDSYRTKLDELQNYTLPPATKKELGGILVGDGLDIDAKGRLSVLFPDLSPYVTFKDLKKDNAATELRFTKIENANKQKQSEDTVFQKTAMGKIGICESKIAETDKVARENAKRFDNYVTLAEHDTAVSELQDKLTEKADVTALNEVLKKKITKSDLDGGLINLLNTIEKEQDNAAEDRENLRSMKSDISSLNSLRQLVDANSKDINYLTQDIRNFITADALKDFVVSEPGKGLSERSFTNEDWNRLQSLHNYTLPPANKINLGGVKAGDNVEIAEDGTLNVRVPTVKDFITKEASEKITGDLDSRLTECEGNVSAHTNTLNTMSLAVSASKDKISSLEDTAREHATTLMTLATKTELNDSINAIDKAKVDAETFKRHTETKIGADNLNEDLNIKLNKTVTMAVDIEHLQTAMQNAEADVVRCFDRIKRLNNIVSAIRNDIPNATTYVRALPGKALSSNDFTDALKDKLSSALVANDINVKVVGLNENNKIDKKYLPDSASNVLYVEDITKQAEGSQEVLYFNKADKKIYYYDGMNFQKTHDGFYNDKGIDLRTEMADLYAKKSELKKMEETIHQMQEQIEKLNKAETA